MDLTLRPVAGRRALFLPVLLVLVLIFFRWRKHGELQREAAERKRAEESYRDAMMVRIANVAPRTTPSMVREGQIKRFEFNVNDPGDDTFSFAAGYPKCGEGSRLAGKKMGTSGGVFRCRFHSGPAWPVVLLRVKDSNGALSNKAARGVMVTSGAIRDAKTSADRTRGRRGLERLGPS